MHNGLTLIEAPYQRVMREAKEARMRIVVPAAFWRTVYDTALATPRRNAMAAKLTADFAKADLESAIIRHRWADACKLLREYGFDADAARIERETRGEAA